MKFGKRRKDDEQPAEEPVVAADHDGAPAEPAADSWTAPASAHTVVGQERPSFDPPAGAVVEGSAVELPDEPSSATVVGGIARPAFAPEPLTMQKPEPSPSPSPLSRSRAPLHFPSPRSRSRS